MASKEKIKKKAKLPSPAVRRKSVGSKDKSKEKIEVEIPQEDPQGSQVSVRSAVEENIKDNTGHDTNGTPSTWIPSPSQSSVSPQHSANDHKKMKKDHVDEKLTKTTSPKDGKNAGGGMASMGSAVSLRSNMSRASKEAWVESTEENEKADSKMANTDKPKSGKFSFPRPRDNKVAPEDSTTTNTKSRPRRESNVVSPLEPAPKPREKGLQGITVDAEEDCPEKHAYIPYLYARNCISKIMEDMSAMKQNHVVIVEKIQHHYGTIETETQSQFNMFVLCIKEDYLKKRKAFRQVIDVHKEEIEKKEKYWNEMLTSLAERNNRLLKEKKMLLMTSKTEIERMEKEKDEYASQMNEKIDKLTAPVPVPASWEQEKKVLMDQLETEKATVASLEQQIGTGMVMGSNPAMPKTEVPVTESVALAAAGAGTGAMIGGGAVAAYNKKLLTNIEEEKKKMNEERDDLNAEREKFGEERKKWMDEIDRLQADIGRKDVVLDSILNAHPDTSDLSKTGNEWKVKHDVIKLRLEEAALQQANYQALENQYAALALIVKNSDTSAAIQEELKKTEEEKKMMQEEKVKMDKEIQQFEKDFVKKNGRKPTEDDKSDSVKEMYTTQQEVKYMVTSLEQKETTYKQIEQGTIPDPPQVTHVPIDTKDPEVVTTEVKVPDPIIIKELETIQIELTTTKTEVITLQQDVSDLKNQIVQRESEIAKQKDVISDLERRLTEGGGAPTVGGVSIIPAGGGASEEELEALKQENRELRRDMKKMIKQYERLSQRHAAAGEGGDASEQMTEMTEVITQLDSKVADLETENESLREERTILRERVKTITETITITHHNENTEALEERDKQIEQLNKELEKLKEENTEMQKDMKKMFKQYAKSKMRVDELKEADKAVRLLEVVAMLIHEIHSEVPDASTRVRVRLDDIENETTQMKQSLDVKQAAYQAWVEKFQSEKGFPPEKGHSDPDAEKLHADWEIAKREYKQKHLHLSALQLIKTGDTAKAMEKEKSSVSNKAEIEVNKLEQALQTADGKVIDLESENDTLLKEKEKYKGKTEELEKMVEDLKKQVEADAALLAGQESSADLTEELGELRKKCDGIESELMQEKVSHMNTRDELETLRKQMEVLKEETENEKHGLDARVQAATAALESQLNLKDEELTSMKTRNDELEVERLSKLPPDTAKEIKDLQDKLKKEKADTSGNKASSAALTAQLADLTAQLEVSSKNLESQRASNRELESKLKSMRQDKEKETKRVSRHMEEKQQKNTSEDKQRITVLVKRVKELEAQIGRGVGVVGAPVAGGGGSSGGKQGGAEVHMLRRDLKDKEAQIKQLEKELRVGGGTSVSGNAADKMGKTKQEKILKELERKMESEKNKSEKLLEGLKAADEENQALKKELDEKSKGFTKVSAELKTISMAAKEGVEAAGKVKELEKDNKKLTEENVVLTKNFESERVLRKKYYNMVEDMKGKIRVYCRARPLSKTELSRGNKPVCRSGDEYSIAVNTTRGLKEFQYDQVFMEDSTQEKIFEDSNNLIQSAVDGYNVCIFAYGQTGSGKTFTMIGDKEQKFPGIAPRAFERVFQLIDELKSKFKITVECYMLELYNDKLIDLFGKPSGDHDKLDIKKDQKGMVYIQGAVIKSASNSKELFALFEEGSTNRHVASTKMNAESSRSHLVIGIVMESTNRNTGNVTKGKLSLVDLAGSERVAKTQAGAEQLKEAMSINKSLSALGDVISALSSEQQFIPYRNNKLTMLMQDSLGGNAKTLMFVNISPADYNMDETVISLTYASRVKLITNDASKNADNKEIARLKNRKLTSEKKMLDSWMAQCNMVVIAKLKQGEQVDEDV